MLLTSIIDWNQTRHENHNEAKEGLQPWLSAVSRSNITHPNPRRPSNHENPKAGFQDFRISSPTPPQSRVSAPLSRLSIEPLEPGLSPVSSNNTTLSWLRRMWRQHHLSRGHRPSHPPLQVPSQHALHLGYYGSRRKSRPYQVRDEELRKMICVLKCDRYVISCYVNIC